MMIRYEITRAIADLGLIASPLSAARTHEVAEQMEEFALPGTRPLWERLRTQSSLQDPHGWRLIGGFEISRPVILFVREPGACGFEFNSILDVVAVLGDTFGFEFYLTDLERSFLFAFNHHDFLIGAGLAAQWIDTIRSDVATELGFEFDAEEQDLIARCLRACVDGPFFPETEFETLFNATHQRVADIAAFWPTNANDLETQSVVLSALANLMGYPHLLNEEFTEWIGNRHAVSRILHRLSSARTP